MAEKQCNLLKNGGGTGTKLKSVFSGTAGTYGNQADVLRSTFDTLTNEQKMSSWLIIGWNILYLVDLRGMYTASFTTTTGKYIRTLSLRSDAVFFSDWDGNMYNNTNVVNPNGMYLYWYE